MKKIARYKYARKVLIAIVFTFTAQLTVTPLGVADDVSAGKGGGAKPDTDMTLLKKPVTRELKGVTMPEEMLMGGKKLVLNGLGLREVQILALYIKVYVAGLYLDKKTSNGDEVVNSPATKVVDLHFLRHVSVGDFYESIEKGVSHNCLNETCDEAKAKLKDFKPNLKPISEGDTLEFVFDSHSVNISLNGEKLGTIDSAPFIKALLSTWVGQKPVTDELKHGLLGADR